MPFEQLVEIKLNTFAIVSLIAFVFTVWIAKVAFDRRKQRGAFYLSMWMSAISFWLLMAVFQYSAYDLGWNIFWAKMLYWGIVQIPVWYIFFAWSFTGHSQYINRRNTLLQLIVPIIVLVLVWTNEAHHLIWTSYKWLPEFKAWDYGKGIGLYVIIVGYIYLNLLYGSFYLLRMILKNYREMGTQSIFILAAVLIPWVVNILYMFNQTNIGLDPTPLVLMLSGCLFVFALFRLKLLNLVGIARGEVIESMADGVLIIDSKQVVLDYNPALTNLVGGLNTVNVGENIESALAGYPELLGLLITQNVKQVVVLYTQLENRKHEVTISPLFDSSFSRGQMVIGRMVLIRDITMTAKAKELLAEKNHKLEEQLAQNEALREQLQEAVIRDSLTGLYNRRFFEELVGKELSTARRHGRELCMMLFDIDNFKKFNDTYGHLAGDELLRTLGKFLVDTARHGDIVCRYGGEEFVAVFTDTTPELLHQRAELLLDEIRNLNVVYEGQTYHFSISLGIGSYPMDGTKADDILKAADDRMYRAKQNGRDQVWSYLNETVGK